MTYRPAKGDPAAFVARLADAVAGGGEELDEAALPRWPSGEPVPLHSHANIVSLLEILSVGNGRFNACHPAMARDPAIARRVEDALRSVPGVMEAIAPRGAAADERRSA